jgi:ferredoxin--NADP+ reductase
MSCGCERSPDFCRGWHALDEAEWQAELAALKEEEAKASNQNTKYHEVTVLEVHHTTPTLFKIRTTKPEGYSFKPGEFTMIGLPDTIKRAYSFTSAPWEQHLEFYSIKAPNGELTEKLKYVLPGDTMHIGKKAKGTLLLDNFTPGGERVWFLGTGTGIAPYMSILRSRQLISSYERKTYVLWSVRKQEDLLAYKEELIRNSFIHFMPIVTQEDNYVGWTKRMQVYLENPAEYGLTMMPLLDPEKDRVMLCGSMEFNEDLRDMLEERGFTEGSNQSQGTYVLEKAFVG